MPTKRSFRNAVKWAYVMQGSEQGLNTLFTMILAMLLGPKDFGILAMAMAYILFAKMFLEQGLVTALIQKKDLAAHHLDSVFCLNLAGSFFLMAVSIGLSHWAAAAYHLPVLAGVITVLSLSIPLEGLTIVQKATLQRELNFRSLSIRSIVAVLAGGVLGLLMAIRGYGVWALVGKQLCSDLVGLVTLWRLSHWRPRLKFSFTALKELLSFSVGTFVGNLGLYINGQLDALLIGFFFGPVSVGLFRFADRTAGTVVSAATSSLQAAAFPEFCRLQDKPEELRRSVLSCFRASAVLTIPALAGLAAVSKPLMVVMGPKWADGADALAILCLAAMVRPVLYFVGPLIQALGKPHYLAVLEWFHMVISVASLSLAGVLLKHQSDRGQVTGMAAIRFVTAVLIITPIVMLLLKRFADIRLSAILGALLPSAIAALATGLGVYLISALPVLGRMKPWPILLVEIAVGGAIGASILIWLDSRVRQTLTEVVLLLRTRFLMTAESKR